MTNTTLDHSLGVQITVEATDPAVLRETGRLMAQLPDETIIKILEEDTRGDESDLGDWEPWALEGWLNNVLLKGVSKSRPMTLQAQSYTADRSELLRIVDLIERMPPSTVVDAEYALDADEDPDQPNSLYESVGDIEPQNVRNVLQPFLPEPEQTPTSEG